VPVVGRWVDHDYTIRGAELTYITERMETEFTSAALVQCAEMNAPE
jgi:hypothetical protein